MTRMSIPTIGMLSGLVTISKKFRKPVGSSINLTTCNCEIFFKICEIIGNVNAAGNLGSSMIN
jgi:hypothetical protein